MDSTDLQTHKAHIYSDGSRVFFPKEYTTYEDFKKEYLLGLIFDQLKLMIEFLNSSSAWSIQELLEKIDSFHKNDTFIISNSTYDVFTKIYKEYDNMSIQINHLKHLIHFLQEECAQLSTQITEIQENLSAILKTYISKFDINLKMLLINKCKLQGCHTLTYDQLKKILYYFGEEKSDPYDPRNRSILLQKLEIIYKN